MQRHSKDTLNDFFADVKFIAEFLHHTLFKVQENQAEIDCFYITSKKCRAEGVYDEKGFTVLKGSVVAQKDVPSFSWKEKRQQLLARLVDKTTEQWIVRADDTFYSPSTVASFCTGSSVNGWIEWKNNAGKTLDEVYPK